MTSILTNGGAIVALQTLKMTNKNLAMTQSQISTGKAINSASDGSAIWAVAKTMETDRDAFKTIQSGLNVAAKVVSTAVENADGIVDDLNKIKTRLSSSSNSDQDAAKNWNEIKELIDGIEAKINGSQINGVNLLNNNGTGNDGKPYKVLASLDRSYGNATTGHSSIEVESVDLKTAILDKLKAWKQPAASGNAEALISGKFGYKEFKADQDEWAIVKSDGTTPDATREAALTAKYSFSGTDADGNAATDVDGTDVLDATIADQAALDAEYADFVEYGKSENSVESLISVAIEKTAQLGAKQHRIESQAESVGKIADNLTAGIGAMVDANLEEASARLQALQAQQQLGIQALSIANQAPQSILSLFR